ncbi:MAG: hypothetical protein LAP87_08295 [Acidobacteriia bacterium]|nr:hypothetical protein [Terriglobia bacterium]
MVANQREFRRLCPDSVSGYTYLRSVKDAAEADRLTHELRALLERSQDPEDAAWWSTLWAAEFRLSAPGECASLRERIAADVRRLASLPAAASQNARWAMVSGYKLSGQEEAGAKIEAALVDEDQLAFRAYQAWETSHRLRTRNNIPQAERKAIWDDEARHAAEWVGKWPGSATAWSFRLTTLPSQPGWTKEELEKAGEEYLRLSAARHLQWNYVPAKLRVAQQWIKYGIRPGDSLALAEEALAEISLGPAVPNDMTAPAVRPGDEFMKSTNPAAGSPYHRTGL